MQELRFIGGPAHGQKLMATRGTFVVRYSIPRVPQIRKYSKEVEPVYIPVETFSYRVFRWSTGYGGACLVPDTVKVGYEMDYILEIALSASIVQEDSDGLEVLNPER